MKAEREDWFEAQDELDPDRLIFLDETATTTNMVRRYGWAVRGERCRVAVPHGHWKTTTVTAALRTSGVAATVLFDGATNGQRFRAYVTDTLVPVLKRGDTVIMDNLATHKVDATVAQRQDAYSKFHEGQATPEEEAALLKRAQAKDGFISEEAANGWVQVNRNKREALQEQARKEAERVQLMDRLNSQEAQLTSTGVEAFRTGRTFSLPQVTILNKKGEEEVLGGDKFRERAAADFEQWSTQYAQQKGESWDQTVLREAPIYAQNGFAPKKWKDMLSQGGASISASALSGEDPPESAQRGYALYKLLHANSSRLLNDLVPKDQRDLYEMWRVGEEDAGLAPGKSLLLATEATNDPAGRLKRISSVTAKDIKAKVGSLGSTFGTLFGGQSAPENLGDMGATIQRLAESYASLGLGADKAIERAVERVQRTHVNVNGFWIDASDRRIPEDFPVLAGDVLKAYAEKHGKTEGIEASGLTVRNVLGAGDVWHIVRKADGIPVDDRSDGVFRIADLQRAAAARQAAVDAETRQRITGRYDPLFVIPGTTIGMSKPNLSGYSPAEVEQINRNIDRESPRQLDIIREDAARTAKVQQEAETEGLERLGEALKPKSSPFKPSIRLRDSKR